MAHGKETPRQKMIGMMYLVLTALLALNVSAEVLNAFILVDKSLRKSNENTKSKNDEIYSKFAAAYNEQKNKVEVWKKKADEAKIQTEELLKQIDDLQFKIVETADGKETKYKEKGPDAIQKKDDNNVPSQIMILEQKGNDLKSKIDKYRDQMIGLLSKDKAKDIITGINNTLYTGEVTDVEGNKKAWEVANFKDLPLVGVITILSKMKNDIRNVETDVINWLFGQIDAGSFKFNKIEAIVKSSTNYVLVGEKYEAQVFIAAYDSTVAPTIMINGGGQLPVKDGKGVYQGATGSIGIKQWGGVIKMISPLTKDTLRFPFKNEYTVAAPSISVSPTKMNVFYIGVDNPVDITASGVPADKLQIGWSGAAGKIEARGNGQYIVQVKEQGKVTIGVSAKLEGNQVKNLGSKEFRVKTVPDPIAMVGGKKDGAVFGVNDLKAQSGVAAVLENFDFELNFRVISFTVSTTIRGFVEEKKSNSAAFTAEQKVLIGQAGSGKKIYLEDIMAVGPDGSPRKLNSLMFRLR